VSTLPSTFVVRERIRWSDCDPLGIVFYGAYLRFFEIAEFEFLRSLGLPYNTLRLEHGVWLPRKAFGAEFHHPAVMDEEIDISIGVTRVGTTSITFQFEVTRASDGARRASASSTVVCVDKSTFSKQPIPAWLREKLQRGPKTGEGNAK
jgi:acyl-CoA thioester hydrolase